MPNPLDNSVIAHFPACWATKENNLTIFKKIAVQSIFDWARQNIKPLNAHYNREIFMDDAQYEWLRRNYNFLKAYHPDKLQAFYDASLRLGNNHDKEWWSFFYALQCADRHRCKEAVCPICQLIEEEEAAAALTKA